MYDIATSVKRPLILRQFNQCSKMNLNILFLLQYLSIMYKLHQRMMSFSCNQNCRHVPTCNASLWCRCLFVFFNKDQPIHIVSKRYFFFWLCVYCICTVQHHMPPGQIVLSLPQWQQSVRWSAHILLCDVFYTEGRATFVTRLKSHSKLSF